MEKMTFVKAMNSHFGRKPGQDLAGFSAEMKELTNKDRLDLVKEFSSIGIEITNIDASGEYVKV